jgi:hypothetical protein
MPILPDIPAKMAVPTSSSLPTMSKPIFSSKIHAAIQELPSFVDLMASLPEASPKNKNTAEKIKAYLAAIHHFELHPDWYVTLSIFDRDMQYAANKAGVYWRKWSVYFQGRELGIEAETAHTSDSLGHLGDDFTCNEGLFLADPDLASKNPQLDKIIGEFIQDALAYKQYVTDRLNEIEIDVAVDVPA